MENNEIMVTEEVMENATEVATDSKNGVAALVGVGLVILAGVAAYKIGKKIIAKVKESKKAAVIEADFDESETDEDSTEEI